MLLVPVAGYWFEIRYLRPFGTGAHGSFSSSVARLVRGSDGTSPILDSTPIGSEFQTAVKNTKNKF